MALLLGMPSCSWVRFEPFQPVVLPSPTCHIPSCPRTASITAKRSRIGPEGAPCRCLIHAAYLAAGARASRAVPFDNPRPGLRARGRCATTPIRVKASLGPRRIKLYVVPTLFSRMNFSFIHTSSALSITLSHSLLDLDLVSPITFLDHRNFFFNISPPPSPVLHHTTLFGPTQAS